jgi:hypothetical protein
MLYANMYATTLYLFTKIYAILPCYIDAIWCGLMHVLTKHDK